MLKRRIKVAKANGTLEDLYAREVRRRIGKKFDLWDELAILYRGTDEERTAHEEYVAQCKAEVKKEFGL